MVMDRDFKMKFLGYPFGAFVLLVLSGLTKGIDQNSMLIIYSTLWLLNWRE